MLTKTFLVNTARIHGLSREQEEVFLMTILKNMSREQIETELGISVHAVSKRLGGVYEKFQIPGKGRGKEAILRKKLIDEFRGSIEASNQELDESANVQALNVKGENFNFLPLLASHPLAQPLQDWFKCLGYEFENQSLLSDDCFEWVIRIKVRRGYDRIVVHGVQGEVSVAHLQALRRSVDQQNGDEGWVVVSRRISQVARRQSDKPENSDLFCYTFDELIEQDVNFDGYFDWIEKTVQAKGIASEYVNLGCKKPEVLPDSREQEVIEYSFYGEEQGWLDGYVDLWLADSAKEHLSILGEFGTGKTWFTLHYAWVSLQRYQSAKKRGLERPRIPLLIPLRECAKAVSLKSILLEFFFNQHRISIPDYAVFEQLNRMGKLLLIFDGFDEMADRVNHQSMINNFWELARVVVPGAKAILTCRTEHFPDAKAGRALLNAELQASTAKLTGETPQFEVLELEEFDDRQIQQVLTLKTNVAISEKVINRPELLSLARRPLMIELILDALPDIEAGKPIDLARVYLYAIGGKLERDIKSARTFTSLADKLYFLCEISWEMLSTAQMRLSYKHFPDRIRQFFGNAMESEIELDHWHYDMMGQTMLIRNEYGEYMPAHRSFLEFFVAYKLVAALGCLAPDFVGMARQQSHINLNARPKPYAWSDYFRREITESGQVVAIAPLIEFSQEKIAYLYDVLGREQLPKVLLELMAPMLGFHEGKQSAQTRLTRFLTELKGPEKFEVDYLSGNVINLLLKHDSDSLQNYDLSDMQISSADFTEANLRGVDFTGASLKNCIFPQDWGGDLSVTFSSNGKFLAIVDSAGGISLWDMSQELQLWNKKGHTDWIRAVAFDLKNQMLATGSHDKTIKLWDVQTGELIRTLENESRVYTLAFSSDYNTLASGGDETVVKLWDIHIGKCRQQFAGNGKWIEAVSFGQSKFGEILATGSDDGQIRLWSLKDGNCIQTLDGDGPSIQSIAFSPDGAFLVSGGTDRCVRLWNIQTGQSAQTFQGHTGWVRSVEVSPDGKLIASASNDKTIKIWQIETGQCKRTIDAHTARVWSVAFNPHQMLLASGSDDRTVKLWNPQTGECLKTLWGNSQGLWSIQFSADGQTLVCGSDDHRIQSWDVASQQNGLSFQGHRGRVRAISLSQQHSLLASGSDDTTIKLWDLQTGDCLETLENHDDWVWSVAISPDERLLASGSLDETVMLWDLETRQHVHTCSGHTKFVWSVTWNSTGSLLASGSADQTIKLWDPATGHCLQTLQGHTHQVTSIDFAPGRNGDRNLLASGSDDETIRIWDGETGTCLNTLKSHHAQVRAIAFSPDGSCLASAGLDRMITLWDVKTGQYIRDIDAHAESIASLRFSPCGQWLASVGEAGLIRLFEVNTGKGFKQFMSDSPYKGMNITKVEGLKPAQKATLLALGAICND